MGKTWWLPIIQNILIISLGYFFWDTHFWITVLIFIYVFLSIPNILLTSSWEVEIQQAFIYLFVFYFASRGCCGLTFLSLLQFVCKWHLKSSSLIAKMKKQKNTKIYGMSHPFYGVHDMTSTNATFAKWVGKVVGKGMSFHGPSYVLQVASLSDSYLSSSELSGSRHKLLQ